MRCIIRLGIVALLLSATSPRESVAQVTGSCSPSVGDAYLDINNVRARIPNNGALFWRSNPNVYEVPVGGVNAIFATSIVFAGLVDGELRAAATRYGPYEFWSGPINDDGSAPADCSLYDRVWKVSRSDVLSFENGIAAVPDLAQWPSGLGAPTLSPRNPDGSETQTDGVDNDRDGILDETGEMRSITEELLALPLSQRIDRLIDLDSGERPDILGDQTLWWIMNDVGNDHYASDTLPIGLEVHASAFGFDRPGDIGNATFYRYKLFYKGSSSLSDAYMGIYSDVDLGNFDDDYVGSDTTLGLGITYNADNDDEEVRGGYGLAPPAIGFDFIQGPVVESAADTAFLFQNILPGHKRLQMTAFRWINGGGGSYSDPYNALGYYNYMQDRWLDGSYLTIGGYGTTAGNPRTFFHYPGDASKVEFWSELNIDGLGTPQWTGDRRFMMASGPFSLVRGETQDIFFAVVWARGNDNIDSYVKLKVADRKVQNFFDAGFDEPSSPDAPIVLASETDRQITLTWTNPDSSNNALDAYRESAPAGDPDNPFQEFEGYEVWQFDLADDSWPACVDRRRCHILETFDVENGVTLIRGDEDDDGFVEVYASGTDSGIRHALTLDDVVNYQTYHYGVRSYAFNQGAAPSVLYSPFARVSATPSKSSAVLSADALTAAAEIDGADVVAHLSGVGNGSFTANVVDPAAIRACSYRVVFYSNAAGITTYDAHCGDEKLVDGSARSARFGKNIGVFDGLEFSIESDTAGFNVFTVVANAAGPLSPPEMGTFAFNSNGFPLFNGEDRPISRQQANASRWGINAGGDDPRYPTFVRNVLRGDNGSFVGIDDYEIRFTQAGGKAFRAFDDGTIFNVPFELWRTGIATRHDPSDDVRLIPFVCEEACGAGTQSSVFDIGGDHPVSGGINDPFTDWVYWYLPEDESIGQAGYNSFFAGTGNVGHELFAQIVLVNWNGGSDPPYNAALPETGTVFRITTNKPLQPGDVFTFDTSVLAPREQTQDEKIAGLEQIGVVPNPYRGQSAYELSNKAEEVRFSNMPDIATVRVFTLSGQLIRTLQKNSPGRAMSWDLRNESGRRIASGMYLIHVEVPGVGERTIKFGFVGRK